MDSVLDWVNEQLVHLAVLIVNFINNYVADFFELPEITAFLNFSSWINILVFSIAFIAVLVDLAEEKTSEKPIYPGIAFLNIVKALAFALLARWLAEWSMELSNLLTTGFGIELNSATIQSHIDSIWQHLVGSQLNVSFDILMILIVIIATLVFTVSALKRFGTMFIHILSSALYIPDIMRGDTTKMGEWLRQMISIVLTYTFIYFLFFLGAAFFNKNNGLMCIACWIAMPMVSKVLNKFGWSSGSQGSFGAVAIQTGAMLIR